MKRLSATGRRSSAVIPCAVLAVAQLQRDREAEIGNERERMRRVDRQRRQHRKDLLAGNDPPARRVSSLDSASAAMLSMPSFCSSTAAGRHRLFCWSSCSRPTSTRSCSSCCSGVRPSGLRSDNALAHLAGEAGHAHHEEFVEVGGRDRQEAHPLQQRMADVLRFLQNAAVELQPGEFAIDEAVGIARNAVAVGRGHGRKLALGRLQLAHVVIRPWLCLFIADFRRNLPPDRLLRQFDFMRSCKATRLCDKR